MEVIADRVSRLNFLCIAGQVPVDKDGTTGRDLQSLVEQSGFRGFLVQPSFEALQEHLGEGRPLVVDSARGKRRHAMELAGFNAGRQQLFLNDPASGHRDTVGYTGFRCFPSLSLSCLLALAVSFDTPTRGTVVQES